MHEYGLMQDVVDLAVETCRKADGRPARCVRIEVGEFTLASRESLETAYTILTQGTPLESSSLEITEVPGKAACPSCGFTGSAADLDPELCEPPAVLLCPRCGSPLLVTSGAGIALVEVQLTDRGRRQESEPAHGVR
ncbi:MAG TPA: hydrogenase maturation nickel metallochaperone HypA [Thermoplasmata archaeon]|nr:hydrogenase maturation nickel metallochaperone HypA [Thermoplasmata archaeon]